MFFYLFFFSGSRRFYDFGAEDYFINDKFEMNEFSERSLTREPSSGKYKIPREPHEIFKSEEDFLTKPNPRGLHEYPHYEAKEEPSKILKSVSSKRANGIHGRAPEPTKKTTPNAMASNLFDPKILRQGPNEYDDLDLGPNPQLGIVSDSGLGKGLAPRGGLGKNFMPGVPDTDNLNGRSKNHELGFNSPWGSITGSQPVHE